MHMFIPYAASMATTAGIPYKQRRLGFESWQSFEVLGCFFLGFGVNRVLGPMLGVLVVMALPKATKIEGNVRDCVGIFSEWRPENKIKKEDTPPQKKKTDMEPENHPEKENNLPNLHFCAQNGSLSGG